MKAHESESGGICRSEFSLDSVSGLIGTDDSVVAFLRDGGLEMDPWDEVGDDSGVCPAESFLRAAMHDPNLSQAVTRPGFADLDGDRTTRGRRDGKS